MLPVCIIAYQLKQLVNSAVVLSSSEMLRCKRAKKNTFVTVQTFKFLVLTQDNQYFMLHTTGKRVKLSNFRWYTIGPSLFGKEQFIVLSIQVLDSSLSIVFLTNVIHTYSLETL